MQHLLTCCAYAAVVLHWVHQDAAAGGGAAPGSRAPDAAAGALRVYRPWWGFQNRMSRILSPSRASGVPPPAWSSWAGWHFVCALTLRYFVVLDLKSGSANFVSRWMSNGQEALDSAHF